MGLSNCKIFPLIIDKELICTDISSLVAKREFIEKVFIDSTYESAVVSISLLPKNRKAIGISVDVVEELDKDTIAKIDAIVNNECYVTYWDGKKSRRFLMKEACK